MESVKVYRNRGVRAESAETFTIDVVLHDAQNGLSPPHLNFSGAEKSGYLKITVIFHKYPDFSAPEKLRWEALDHFEHRVKLRRL